MSVLMEFAMFPTDRGESVSKEVSQVIDTIRQKTPHYQLTAMGTIVETDTIQEALDIISACYTVLEELGSERVYSSIKFDIRKKQNNRLIKKIQSIKNNIGEINT
jgi:uncharacterized protein (TIGR00106 family)